MAADAADPPRAGPTGDHRRQRRHHRLGRGHGHGDNTAPPLPPHDRRTAGPTAAHSGREAAILALTALGHLSSPRATSLSLPQEQRAHLLGSRLHAALFLPSGKNENRLRARSGSGALQNGSCAHPTGEHATDQFDVPAVPPRRVLGFRETGTRQPECRAQTRWFRPNARSRCASN